MKKLLIIAALFAFGIVGETLAQDNTDAGAKAIVQVFEEMVRTDEDAVPEMRAVPLQAKILVYCQAIKHGFQIGAAFADSKTGEQTDEEFELGLQAAHGALKLCFAALRNRYGL